jgi:hypothetical protein
VDRTPSWLFCGGALLATLVTVVAVPSRAAAAPSPDPYPSKPSPAAKSSARTPDPAPGASVTSTSTATVPSPDVSQSSSPAPPPAPQTPASTGTKKRHVERAAPPPHTPVQPRINPRVRPIHESTLAAGARQSISTTSGTDALPLLLAALGLFALALASGSLLHLLSRMDGTWRKA